jgi:tetrahydromethanopterin S-methyltransferase subunit H
MEVREVYESEMERTVMLDTNSQKPNIESRMKVLEN